VEVAGDVVERLGCRVETEGLGRHLEEDVDGVLVVVVGDVDARVRESLDVGDPLVLRQGSKPETAGHNALIRDAGYSQRWMAETSYSSVKRSLGSAVQAHFWYREFREIVLKFAVSNIEQLCESL
jgi:IS5 family transposase